MRAEFLDWLTEHRLPYYISSDTIGELIYLTEAKAYIRLCFLGKSVESNIESFLRFKRSGEQLIHLWEDVWGQKKSIVQSRILSLNGRSKRIHGRKTIAVHLDKKAAYTFLEENHLQAALHGRKQYGLLLGEEIVAAASFGPIKSFRPDYKSGELIRFCNKRGVNVVGGLSKLLKHYILNNPVQDIMTYSDNDWSTGRSYEKLGFIEEGIKQPGRYFLDLATGTRCLTPIPNAPTICNTGSLKWRIVLQ